MIYFVRTVTQRKLDQSYNQINYNLFIDEKHQPIDSFINCLYQINDTDTVLLEDDLILCNNFEEEVKKATNRYPNKIINFFQNPFMCLPIQELSDIFYNQCTFYPKNVPKQIADIMITLPRETEGIHKNQYSRLESQALKELGLTVIQYRPHLVQHLDLDTTLFPMTYHNRRSPFFLDYLNQLGITYNEAQKHIKELQEIKRKHFEELCK